MKLWLRPLPFALAAGFFLARAGRAPIDDASANRSVALCGALGPSGVTCVGEDVTWMDGPNGIRGATVGSARALVRGHEREKKTEADFGAPVDKNDTFDLFMVRARLSPEGHLLDVDDVHNLTRTSGADEGLPVLQGSFAAYVVAFDGKPKAVHVMDLTGHDVHAYEELTRFQRFQVAVADWQQTGRSRGVKRTVYALVPPPSEAALAFRDDGMLEIRTDARALLVSPENDSVVEGTAYLRVTPEVVAKPPTFAPWMSDRLRAASWFGDEKNQILKVVTFTAIEWMKALKAKLTGDTGEKDAQEDLASLNQSSAASPAPSFTDPEIGWPPKPLDPLMKPPLNGEGQWIALEKDAFITPIPGVRAPFLTTFVRGDPAAPQTRVYVTLWDPRLVALHMEAGTVEPVSATGEAGPGQIPRTPEIVRRVVAGFNGGFQATHGEFGMQANGVLYLPPKPYAATVLELRDGTTAFGAWPRNTEVPDEVLSFRQNMTALVQNDKYNPWGRLWWGGVPPGWHDAIHTTRSGLCLTKEGFVAYFWGNDIGPEPLGRAMLVARCSFGIHLDMNPGLAGFEFYNVQTTSNFQPLGRPLQPDWEYEGGFKDLPDFKFRSRRMVKSMGHMLFPRYIHRDARDFFYLTARTVLPGAPIGGAADAQAEGEAGNWRVKALPQHGYPYAVAVTSLRLGPEAGEKRVRILKVDPRTVRAQAGSGSDERTGESAPRNAGAGSDAGPSSGEGANPSEPLVVLFAPAGRAGKGRAGAPEKPGAGRRAVTTGGSMQAGNGGSNGAAASAGTTTNVGDGSPSSAKLWLGPHVFAIESTPPRAALAIANVTRARAVSTEAARAAAGISDEEGMLYWVELLPEDAADAATSDAMLRLLERVGCSSRGLVEGDVRALLGGTLDIGGEATDTRALDAAFHQRGADVVRLLRTPAPGARAIFDSVEVVPQSVWHPLQAQRVKWRPTLAPPEKPAASSSAGASAAPSAPPTPPTSTAPPHAPGVPPGTPPTPR